MRKYTTLAEELNALPPERQASIAARANQIRLEESTLRHLREKLGLSQAELAQRLEVQQPAISKVVFDFKDSPLFAALFRIIQISCNTDSETCGSSWVILSIEVSMMLVCPIYYWPDFYFILKSSRGNS